MNQQPPITPAVFKGLSKPRSIADPDDGVDDLPPLTSQTLYTAGLEMSYYRGHQIISHDGMTSGYGSVHFFLPHFKFGGVILGEFSDYSRDHVHCVDSYRPR